MKNVKNLPIPIKIIESKNNLENKKMLDVVIIQQGWSFNDFYYTESSLVDIVNLINTTSVGSYIDHKKPNEGQIGRRSVHDLLGILKDATLEKDSSGVNQVKATLISANIAPTNYVFDMDPIAYDQVGLSIYGEGQAEVGIYEGKKGKGIIRIARLPQADMVVGPSAGGKVINIIESETGDGTSMKTFAQYNLEEETEQKCMDTCWKFSGYLQEIVCNEEITREDKETLLTDGIKSILDVWDSMSPELKTDMSSEMTETKNSNSKLVAESVIVEFIKTFKKEN